MLNYQMAVFFFAWLDVLSTLLNVLTLYAWPATTTTWPPLCLLLLLGPACGYLGASKLKRPRGIWGDSKAPSGVKMTMENGPLIVDLPIKNGDFP